ncbi:MAG TPA: FAD binding domain-containing protein [Candidatus Limnocylindrales bacterium]|nr:FAD binding domain-containing protein [Candidatus Limnocylindrales bacterium]
MIPAPFEYARPSSLDEALELVAGADPSIRVLAGGQSLIPLMKLRLARPQRLIDVGRLDGLRGVRELPGGALGIGAMTTWAALLADARVTAHGALADVLPMIGDVQVRNRGTIGGSLAHADPASDIAAPALALGFEVVARSAARDERILPVTELFTGPFMTSLAPDEILVEIRVPAAPAGSASAYRALPQPASGYPIAGVAVVLGSGSAAIAVTGVGEQPYRATEVEQAVAAGTAVEDAIATITTGQRVNADIHADREYRAAMAAVMARRAHALASSRLGAP